jgi:acyl-CoA reductase-like NAD-dependent aldehyde dehydrogenase
LNKLAFTGSTEVGLTVGLAAAKKNYSLYLGIRGKIS